jgi:hypothetical protein
MPVRPPHLQILLEDSKGGISLISTIPQGQGNMPARDVWCAWKRMTEVIHKTDAVTVTFHFVQNPVSALITHLRSNK